ncbi:MAG: hypothetical protein PHT49_00305 [Desulfovibrionales bacterium]|nr:hypothetical protein [Desulfovibrionales bacterium]
MITVANRIKSYTLNITRREIEKRYLANFKKNNELWEILNSYILASGSTGCGFGDYWTLYNFVRKNKPKEILECGTGISTIVIAYALIENEKEGFRGSITSMESVEEYYNMAKILLPKFMMPYVDIIFSPVIEDYYSLFRGVRYKNIPNKKYDFVYVDGPSYIAPSDGTIAFDYDYLYIVKNSKTPVSAIIDKRVSTCYVLQKVFGTEKVRYNALKHLGFVDPCSKEDILHFDEITPSDAFAESFKIFGNTTLTLKFKNSKYLGKL